MTQTKPNNANHFQTTLKEKLTFSGLAVFSNAESTIHISPAEADHGIVFCIEGVKIPALAEYAMVDGSGFTSLMSVGIRIQMVEHLLSALYGCGIDNALIELDHYELPMLDGSAKVYVDKLLKSSVPLEKERIIKSLEAPIYIKEDNAALIAIPKQGLHVSYTWHYPRSKAFKNLFFSEEITPERYLNEIAPARTFAFYEDIKPAIDAGIIKGANLSQGVLIQDDEVVNPEGLRFSDEIARHKVLDVIGDFSLIGMHLNAHIIAICSGHRTNVQFAQKVRQILTGEQTDGTTIRQADFGCESSSQNPSAQVSLSPR